MRILKLLVILVACFASEQALAQQPWPTTSGSSGETLLAWNGGGHGGRHFHRHHHFHHRHFFPGRGFYRHDPRVIYVPRYYDGYYMGHRPYYYQRYGSPRIVIQYYDPRRGIFVGSDVGGY
ncbi:hypothetical protein NNO07_06740 [Pseudomonas resinovorans]|uniref:Uncharacterized protein n=1 Tax=Metapseudomonas resinovorans TaxID=53412 RepID=A0ABT4Y250_METRE|nr:hypothetical protein [Pseudomonas resinovorans]MDA8482762.1 hypothetical protein [Pseudomonas resinovorans]